MSLPVRLSANANADLVAIRVSYNHDRAGRGDEFGVAVRTIVDAIEHMPEMYGRFWGDVRAAKVRRFPYIVYYVVRAAFAEIIAIEHSSRDAEAWLRGGDF